MKIMMKVQTGKNKHITKGDFMKIHYWDCGFEAAERLDAMEKEDSNCVRSYKCNHPDNEDQYCYFDNKLENKESDWAYLDGEKSIVEIFTIFSNTPGKSTRQEIQRINEFLLTYQEYKRIYKESTGSDPIGMSIEADLKKVKWYLDYLSGKIIPTKK